MKDHSSNPLTLLDPRSGLPFLTEFQWHCGDREGKCQNIWGALICVCRREVGLCFSLSGGWASLRPPESILPFEMEAFNLGVKLAT